jgi:hypothetical protein
MGVKESDRQNPQPPSPPAPSSPVQAPFAGLFF